MSVTIKETNLSFRSLAGRSSTRNLVIHHTGGNAGDDYSAADIHAMHQREGWDWISFSYPKKWDN